jgi:hypothetical protein
MLRAWWLILGVLAGCGSDDSSGPAPDLAAVVGDLAVTAPDVADLAAPPPIDLAGVDAAVDLDNWCLGTLVGSSDGGAISDCVRRYFLPFAACYIPSGACSVNHHNRSSDYCWADGATSTLGNYFDSETEKTYAMNGHMCLWADSPNTVGEQWPQTLGGPVTFCVSSSSHECRGSIGTGPEFATFDGTVFTCPDGTRVDVDFRNCPALSALLASRCPSPSAGVCTTVFPP